MSKVWAILTNTIGMRPAVDLFATKEKALNFAYKWIMEETGGPSAWQPDEWPQMRQAIRERDVEAMIEYFNDSVLDDNRTYILLDHPPVR